VKVPPTPEFIETEITHLKKGFAELERKKDENAEE